MRGHRFRKPGSDMEPEALNATSGEGAGQEEKTESPEEAAQVTPCWNANNDLSRRWSASIDLYDIANRDIGVLMRYILSLHSLKRITDGIIEVVCSVWDANRSCALV